MPETAHLLAFTGAALLLLLSAGPTVLFTALKLLGAGHLVYLGLGFSAALTGRGRD